MTQLRPGAAKQIRQIFKKPESTLTFHMYLEIYYRNCLIGLRWRSLINDRLQAEEAEKLVV